MGDEMEQAKASGGFPPASTPEAVSREQPQKQGNAAISTTAERLLRVAEDVTKKDCVRWPREEAVSPLSEFVQIYREWITFERGRPETHEQQVAQWQIIVHCMITGATIEAAIRNLVRYGPVVWGEFGHMEMRDDGMNSALIFKEPLRQGREGLIGAIWPLALTLCVLEYLSSTKFRGARGRVPHSACLPESTIRLLFGPPLEFESGEVALVIPKRCLQRAVVIRAADLPEFFRQLLPLTLRVGKGRPRLSDIVAGLIRNDKLRSKDSSGQSNIAMRLGLSEATLRRQLREEGQSFREIKEGVYDGLAKDWLNDADLPIEEIASRLGFSEAFAFRRFFRRRNGIPPSAYRGAGSGAQDPRNADSISW